MLSLKIPSLTAQTTTQCVSGVFFRPQKGARYLNPQTGLWLSTDPAMGEYVPTPGQAMNELPGMGGVFNVVNLHVYHYAGNNPVNYVDPNGMWLDNGDGTFVAEKGDTLWDLYGADWKEKSGYEGDPTKLQIGETVGLKINQAMQQFRTLFFNATGGKTTEETIKWFNSQFAENPLTEEILFTLFNSPMEARDLLLADVRLHKNLRDYLNTNGPETGPKKGEIISDGFVRVPFIFNWFHSPFRNNKYVSADGYRERIFNRKTGDLETRNEFKGSFNFFPYTKSKWGHYMADVYPASKWGN
jgi:RHS repeat-associated protein